MKKEYPREMYVSDEPIINTEKQVKEITIKEIAQRFGYPIEQIRIKK